MSYVLNRISQSACSQMATLRKGTLVLVDSDGGLVASAMVIRELIVEKKLKVRFVGECSSAAMFLLGASDVESFSPTAFGRLHKPTRLPEEDGGELTGEHLLRLGVLWSTVKDATHCSDGDEVDVKRLVAISDALRLVHAN